MHLVMIGGSDAGIRAAARDPNFSICGIPYYIQMRITGDRRTGRLLGMQLFGHRHAEIAKRIDIAATATYCDMTVEAVSDLDRSPARAVSAPRLTRTRR